jgi:hypothetical protein
MDIMFLPLLLPNRGCSFQQEYEVHRRAQVQAPYLNIEMSEDTGFWWSDRLLYKVESLPSNSAIQCINAGVTGGQVKFCTLVGNYPWAVSRLCPIDTGKSWRNCRCRS